MAEEQQLYYQVPEEEEPYVKSFMRAQVVLQALQSTWPRAPGRAPSAPADEMLDALNYAIALLLLGDENLREPSRMRLTIEAIEEQLRGIIKALDGTSAVERVHEALRMYFSRQQ